MPKISFNAGGPSGQQPPKGLSTSQKVSMSLDDIAKAQVGKQPQGGGSKGQAWNQPQQLQQPAKVINPAVQNSNEPQQGSKPQPQYSTLPKTKTFFKPVVPSGGNGVSTRGRSRGGGRGNFKQQLQLDYDDSFDYDWDGNFGVDLLPNGCRTEGGGYLQQLKQQGVEPARGGGLPKGRQAASFKAAKQPQGLPYPVGGVKKKKGGKGHLQPPMGSLAPHPLQPGIWDLNKPASPLYAEFQKYLARKQLKSAKKQQVGLGEALADEVDSEDDESESDAAIGGGDAEPKLDPDASLVSSSAAAAAAKAKVPAEDCSGPLTQGIIARMREEQKARWGAATTYKRRGDSNDPGRYKYSAEEEFDYGGCSPPPLSYEHLDPGRSRHCAYPGYEDREGHMLHGRGGPRRSRSYERSPSPASKAPYFVDTDRPSRSHPYPSHHSNCSPPRGYLPHSLSPSPPPHAAPPSCYHTTRSSRNPNSNPLSSSIRDRYAEPARSHQGRSRDRYGRPLSPLRRERSQSRIRDRNGDPLPSRSSRGRSSSRGRGGSRDRGSGWERREQGRAGSAHGYGHERVAERERVRDGGREREMEMREQERDGRGNRGGRGDEAVRSKEVHTQRMDAAQETMRMVEERSRDRSRGGQLAREAPRWGPQGPAPAPTSIRAAPLAPAGAPLSAASAHLAVGAADLAAANTVAAGGASTSTGANGGGVPANVYQPATLAASSLFMLPAAWNNDITGNRRVVENIEVARAAVAIEEVLYQHAGHRVVLPLHQLQRLKRCMEDGKRPGEPLPRDAAGQQIIMQPTRVLQAMVEEGTARDLVRHGEDLVHSDSRHARALMWMNWQLENEEDLSDFFMMFPQFYFMNGQEQGRLMHEWFECQNPQSEASEELTHNEGQGTSDTNHRVGQ